MSPRPTRRALLGALGTATACGLAGCGSADGPTATPTEAPATYGIEVRNELTAQFFQQHAELSEPQPAPVYVRVGNVDPSSEQAYFGRRFELPTGHSRTFDDAFTLQADVSLYAMTAQLETFADGDGDATADKAGFTFTKENRPETDPIPVAIQSDEEDSGVVPYIEIQSPLAEE